MPFLPFCFWREDRRGKLEREGKEEGRKGGKAGGREEGWVGRAGRETGKEDSRKYTFWKTQNERISHLWDCIEQVCLGPTCDVVHPPGGRHPPIICPFPSPGATQAQRAAQGAAPPDQSAEPSSTVPSQAPHICQALGCPITRHLG